MINVTNFIFSDSIISYILFKCLNKDPKYLLTVIYLSGKVNTIVKNLSLTFDILPYREKIK